MEEIITSVQMIQSHPLSISASSKLVEFVLIILSKGSYTTFYAVIIFLLGEIFIELIKSIKRKDNMTKTTLKGGLPSYTEIQNRAWARKMLALFAFFITLVLIIPISIIKSIVKGLDVSILSLYVFWFDVKEDQNAGK